MQQLAEAGERILVLQEGMAATDEAHGKQMAVLQAQLQDAGDANKALHKGMLAAGVDHTAQVAALQAQMAGAKLGGDALQADMQDATSTHHLQVQALRRQLEQAGAASIDQHAGMEAAEGEVTELRHQLADAGAATLQLEGVMAAADEAHREQVAALQSQLADVGAASLDLQAGIATADTARNLQVSAMQRQLAEAGATSQRLQTGIAAADDARNRQVEELQRQLNEAGSTNRSLQASAWATSQALANGPVGPPLTGLSYEGGGATPTHYSGPLTAETSSGECEDPLVSPSTLASEAGSGLDLLLSRMAEDPRASLIDTQRITWCTHPDGSRVLLGEGGFCKVFKVLLDGVQPHAAKVLHLGKSAKEEELFVREACLLKQLRHRNIVGFSGVCVTEEHEGIILMEHMEGRDLQGRLQQRTKSGERRFGWWGRGRLLALDIARAIHYLHSLKLTHFDVKSSNVLLTRELGAKLADVGFTTLLHGSQHSISHGPCGTFNYMAPELLLGSPCTQAVDCWSFGVWLWEICTGGHPARGCCRPLKVPEEAPQELVDLYLECIDPDPSLRPSATQLVQRLSAMQQAPPPAVAAAAAAAATLKQAAAFGAADC